MAAKYKLTYFNGRGLAEGIRLIFAYKGVEYEDNRIERDNWPELKPSTPFGQIPILEVDGHTIAQSRAIARFVANELGLAGKNKIESAKCDMIVDAVFDDAFRHVSPYYSETDEAKKVAIHKKVFDETFPNVAKNLEKILSANNKGVFVGDSVTWADIIVAWSVSSFQTFKELHPHETDDILAKYPNLKEHKHRIFEHPTIKQWIEKRPVTEF